MSLKVLIILLLVAGAAFAEADSFEQQSRSTQNLFKKYANDFVRIGEFVLYKIPDRHDKIKGDHCYDPISDKVIGNIHSIAARSVDAEYFEGSVSFVNKDGFIGANSADKRKNWFIDGTQYYSLPNYFVMGSPPSKHDRIKFWMKVLDEKITVTTTSGDLRCPKVEMVDTNVLIKSMTAQKLFQFYVDNNLSEFPRFTAKKKKTKKREWVNRPLKLRIKYMK